MLTSQEAAETPNEHVSNDANDEQQHRPMIALYYCYTPVPILDIPRHVKFQKDLCTEHELMGRIRVSSEGINGVLSGRRCSLESYEESLRAEILGLIREFSSEEGKAGDGKDGTDGRHESLEDVTKGGVDLDIKYCHLRTDVPKEKQLFDTLSVKETREVVSLYEPTPEEQRVCAKGRRRRRRRNGRNRKDGMAVDGSDSHNGNKGVESCDVGGGKCASQQESHSRNDGVDGCKLEMSGPTLNNATKNIPRSPDDIDLSAFRPAQHLSPEEWNERLLRASSVAGSQSFPTTTESSPTEHVPLAVATDPSLSRDKTDNSVDTAPILENDDNGSGSNDAILIDMRNVYESRIGHFSIPNVPTLLTNTRKYSSVPSVLEASMSHLSGKDVYMYCTGGVRCERASAFLMALSESDSWVGEKPKGLYQLKGGIQRYLERYGSSSSTMDQAISQMEHVDVEGDANTNVTTSSTGEADVFPTGPSDHEKEDTNTKTDERPDTNTAESNNSTTELTCLFRGKNFVFDPRRTDPQVGLGSTKTALCHLCNRQHDDYDNGHSPCDNMEARCCKCRVLVLVCDDCRYRVRCWGEKRTEEEVTKDVPVVEREEGGDVIIGRSVEDEDGANGQMRRDKTKRDLFCGPGGHCCVDEGNRVDIAILRE